MPSTSHLPEDRCFSANPSQRQVARTLYDSVKDLPLISPHGHVDPALLADPKATLGTPADLFIIPDHYVFRMLYSQGVALEDLGISPRNNRAHPPAEQDHRRIWQIFAEHFYLFQGTPTGLWLRDELTNLFGVTEKLNGSNAQRIYDRIAEKLAQPEFSPRALFKQFNVEVLCTTDAATDTLQHHRSLHDEGWTMIKPTFRPDAVINFQIANWHENIARLSEVSGIDVMDYRSFIQALEQRRTEFKRLGATATDHSTMVPYTERLSDNEAADVFEKAMRKAHDENDAARFWAHMLMELARMSVEDGLVMQLHPGSFRSHNDPLFQRFGADMGADIPVQTEYTRNLRALLNAYGNDPRFRLIMFTIDETSYSRELAPLAGHYPALLLGPPWWFFDSVKGMQRYLDAVVETAGIYNLAGFNDDTRAFASIPARHDVWRRVTCNWLAGEVVNGLTDEADAAEMAKALAYSLAKRAYRLE